jgi:cation diffusion facilitator CzcD-associated flavoprotein CzcO
MSGAAHATPSPPALPHDGDGGASVCVIGAGTSGLAACRALSHAGIPFVCVEAAAGIGGLWRYEDPAGPNLAYASLRTNTSGRRMQFASFPIERERHGFLSHAEVVEYLDAYARRHGLLDHIRFGTRVLRVSPAGRRWEVETDGGVSTQRAVVVATGRHGRRRWPRLPGALDGPVIHVADYRTPEAFAGKRVLVMGGGNSAVEVAAELAGTAERVLLSMRRGVHLLPRTLFGRPYDIVDLPALSRLPAFVARPLFLALIRLSRGAIADAGLPAPDHRLRERTATVSEELVPLVRAGAIQLRPGIARLDGAEVQFADGAREPVDAAIYATGYEVHFPFLTPGLVDEQQGPALYRHIAHPDVDGLFFVGILDALGAFAPVVETQGEWIADVLAHRLVLPPPAARWAAIERERERLSRQFVDDRPYTLYRERFPYVRQLEADRRGSRPRPGRLTRSEA